MVKLTPENVSNKVGRPVNIRTVTSISLPNLQIDDAASFTRLEQLEQLDLSGNWFKFTRQLERLFDAPKLKDLDLTGCPVTKSPYYREWVITHCKTLEILDKQPISAEERNRANLLFISPSGELLDQPQEDKDTSKVSAAEIKRRQEAEARSQLEAEKAEHQAMLKGEMEKKERIRQEQLARDAEARARFAAEQAEIERMEAEERRVAEELEAQRKAEEEAKKSAEEKAKLAVKEAELAKKRAVEEEKRAKKDAEDAKKKKEEEEKKAKKAAEDSKKKEEDDKKKAQKTADEDEKKKHEQEAKTAKAAPAAAAAKAPASDAAAKQKEKEEHERLARQNAEEAKKKAAEEEAKKKAEEASKKADEEAKKKAEEEAKKKPKTTEHRDPNAAFVDERTGVVIREGFSKLSPARQARQPEPAAEPKKSLFDDDTLFGPVVSKVPAKLDSDVAALSIGDDDFLSKIKTQPAKKTEGAVKPKPTILEDDLFGAAPTVKKQPSAKLLDDDDLFSMVDTKKSAGDKKDKDDLFDLDSYLQKSKAASKSRGGLFD